MKKSTIGCMIIVLAMMLILAVACGGVTDVESVQLRAVGLKNDVLTLYKGGEAKVSVTIKPAGANAEIQWKTADVTIATVSSDGVVKGVSVGQTKLTVHVGQVEKTIDIVVDDYVPIESISFAKSEMTIDTGVRKQLDFTVLPQNATVKTLSFTVEPTDEGVKVSSSGIVEVAKDVEGGRQFTITARAYNESSVYATMVLTVQEYVLQDILIVDNDFHTEITSIEVPVDEPYRVLFQMPVPEKAIETGEKIPTTWTSSDESVVKVNQKGRLTFYSKGKATITMEAMGFTKTVDVTVTDACGNFVENYYMPQNYIDGIKTITHSSDNGWQTFADFRNGGTGAEDAKKFVLQKYKYHTGPSSWFAGGGFCIEMGGWDNIHSGLEDDDLPGGGMANLFMWCKLKLGGNATKLRTYFQYRETDATFKYKLRHTFVDIETKQVLHLSDWKTGEFKNDPNLVAGETFIESDIPAEYRGKTVIVMLEYDDIDYTTDGILNGVESVNIKYFSVLNFDGQPVENALWVLGDSIMTEDFTGSMVAEIAKESGYTLFRDTISGSTVAPASSIGIVDHIDSGMYANNFGVFGSPKVIVIQRGTNDVYWSGQEGNPLKLGNVTDTDKTTTYGAIRYTLDYFTKLYPQARIIWSTAFYRTDVDDARMRQYNQNLKAICAEYDNVEVFDLYEKTGFNETNAVQYLIDGIHPSNSGKAVLKKLWIELLTK